MSSIGLTRVFEEARLSPHPLRPSTYLIWRQKGKPGAEWKTPDLGRLQADDEPAASFGRASVGAACGAGLPFLRSSSHCMTT